MISECDLTSVLSIREFRMWQSCKADTISLGVVKHALHGIGEPHEWQAFQKDSASGAALVLIGRATNAAGTRIVSALLRGLEAQRLIGDMFADSNRQ